MPTLGRLMDEQQAGKQQAIFERMVENFIKDWGPEDYRENAQFSAQLASIVRQTFLDAQAPVQKQMADIVMRWPMVSVVHGQGTP